MVRPLESLRRAHSLGFLNVLFQVYPPLPSGQRTNFAINVCSMPRPFFLLVAPIVLLMSVISLALLFVRVWSRSQLPPPFGPNPSSSF